MFTSNSYPPSWKKSFIHFIGKSDGVGVRPIALTSCMCKIFETMLKNKLEYWIEPKDILPNSQSGFRKGQSTIDNLTNFTLNIEDAFSSKNELLAAFLDVSGAFDNVIIEILLEKLAQIGCPTSIVQFIKFITLERQIFTQNSENNPRTIHKGVPQGGVLSPLLYNIYVSKITANLPKSIIVSQFADDIVVYIKKSHSDRSKKTLEKSILQIQKNLFDLGLDLAPHKTIFMHFNKNNIKPGHSKITINNLTIPSSESVRFLGIILDYKLSFQPQIDHIYRKSLKSLNLIKFLRGTWWGCDPSTLLILYKSFVRSTLDYGYFIFFPTQKLQIEKIEKIQYAAIRYALGFRISTPTNILLAESKLDPIEERSTYLCLNYIYKIMSNKNLLVHETLVHLNNNLNKQNNNKKYSNRIILQCIKTAFPRAKEIISRLHYNNYAYNYDALTYTVITNSELGTTLKKSTDPNKTLDEFLEKEKAYAIYTDGSKTENASSVGIACVTHDPPTHSVKSINQNASIFTAECIALNQAVDYALTKPNENAIIFTDSLSAIMSLRNLMINVKSNPYILELKKKALEFSEKRTNGSTIQFFWVPAHIGIRGNEKADLLAKAATQETVTSSLKIPFTDLKEQTQSTTKKKISQLLIEQSALKGTDYFRHFYNSSPKPWFNNLKLPREILTTINRCRSGHYSLASSLSKIGLVDSTECECGYEEQDINHILWQCPLYDTHRIIFVTQLNKIKIFLPNTYTSLLHKPTLRLCQVIHSYLKNCELQL